MLTPIQLADSLINVVTLSISILTIYFVARQRIDRMFSPKAYLTTFFVGFALAIVFQLSRDFFDSSSLAVFYNEVGITFLVVAAISLTLLAYITYVRPPELEFSQRVRGLFTRRLIPHGVVIAGIISLAIFIEGYMILIEPLHVTSTTIDGSVSYAATLDSSFLILLVFGFVVFVAYPARLLVLSAIRARSPDERKGILVLIVGSSIIAISSLLATPLLDVVGLYAPLIVHIVIAGTITSYAVVFRNFSIYEQIFERPTVGAPTNKSGTPLRSSSVSRSSASLLFDSPLLLEVDPSSDYDKRLRALVVEETLSGRGLVFVFTYSASSLYRTLRDIEGVRFFVSSSLVSGPRPDSQPNTILMPEHNSPVFLDLLQKTLSPADDRTRVVIFDNLSDWSLSLKPEDLARVLRTALEIVGSQSNGVHSIFLIISKAQSDNILNYVKSQFEHLAVYHESDLRLVK